MRSVGVTKNKTRSVASLTLLAMIAIALPSPSLGQQPIDSNIDTPVLLSLNLSQNTASAYVLGAGDRVRLDVLNVAEYSGEYQVLVDGTLNLPLIGTVPVRGLTLQGASQLISSQYARFLRRPVVTVSLLATRPFRIAISGEVNRPGSYSIPTTDGQFPSLTQALQLAGGTTQSANFSQVQIRRTQAAGGPRVINVNLSAMLRTGNLTQDIMLRDGDTILVPTQTVINPAEIRRNVASNIGTRAFGPFQVAVVGEVFRPGTYTVQGGASGENAAGRPPTLTQAVDAAGGLTTSANISQIQIRRRTRSGSSQVVAVNLLQLLQSGDVNQDMFLQEGDTIVVPTQSTINPAQANIIANSNLATRASAAKIALVGEVFRPGTYTVQGGPSGENGASRPPTLTQAVDAAGGLTASANISQIQIRRRTRSGSSQIIPVNLLQLLQAGDVNQDLFLQEGDTILVPTQSTINVAQANIITNSNLATKASAAKVALVGEVSRPGTYTVQGSSTETGGTSSPPTLAQAIQQAGGATPLANIREIQISRPTRSGFPQVMAVNLLQLLQLGDLNQNITLQDGDTVFIPTRTDANPTEASIIAASTLATQVTGPIKVAIVGEVSRPGTHTVEPLAGGTSGNSTPPTITKAIQVAGGIKSSADIRQVQVRRSTRTGSERVIDVNLWQLLQGGDTSQDILLQEGDTVVIPIASQIDPAEVSTLAESSFSPSIINVNVVGEVTRSGTIEVPPNTSLNQAILAAGGFNNRARQSAVELVRLNPNGTVTKRPIRVDFNQGINDETNPILRNNDVIVVGRSGLANVTDTLGTILSPLGGVFSLFNFFRIFQ